MRFMNEVIREKLYQLLLCRLGSFCCCSEANSCTYSKYVRVHRHIWLLIYYRSDHICGLTAYAWECNQFLHGHGHFTTKLGHQLTSHSYQMLRFVIRIRDAFYQRKQVFKTSFAHSFGCRIGCKDGRCSSIYTLICALCA